MGFKSKESGKTRELSDYDQVVFELLLASFVYSGRLAVKEGRDPMTQDVCAYLNTECRKKGINRINLLRSLWIISLSTSALGRFAEVAASVHGSNRVASRPNLEQARSAVVAVRNSTLLEPVDYVLTKVINRLF